MFWLWRELNAHMLDKGYIFTPSETHAAARVVVRLRGYGFDAALHPATLQSGDYQGLPEWDGEITGKGESWDHQ